ncbi:MAG TPA: hypothetical protein VGI43_05440 [Mucilaginibacter sp.]
MLKFTISFSTIIILLGLCLTTNAQDAPDTISRDYIINLKGDTIKGQVINLNLSSVRIDPFTESHTVKYKAAEIKEVRQTGIIYVPVVPTIGFRDFILAKRLEHGAIDLFEYIQQGNTYSYQTTWFAGKAAIPPSEIKTSSIGGMSRTERKNHLLKLLADNEELTKEFETKNDYSFDYLQDLIRRYNNQAKISKK